MDIDQNGNLKKKSTKDKTSYKGSDIGANSDTEAGIVLSLTKEVSKKKHFQ